MNRTRRLTSLMLSSLLVMPGPNTLALSQLSESEMSQVQGAGLAFPFDQFRFEMAPTSFLQLTGSDTNPAQTTFIRGDLRYYGLTMSRADGGNVRDWNGDPCTPGTFGLGCPISDDYIVNFANFDNPYVWRAFNYSGYDTSGALTSNRAVFEILGPSDMDPFRWSFFGEVEAGRTYGATASNGLYPITGANCTAGTGSNCLTQLQNIIIGKPVSTLLPPSIGASENQAPALRFFQYAGTTAAAGTNPATYGIQYEHRLSGDYRMSVNTTGGTVERGVIPTFTAQEGLYFRDVQTYLPLGQLHYQALVFDDNQVGSSGGVGNGNIAIEVTPIPNVPNVYQDFYSFADGTAGSLNSGYQRNGRPSRYYETHGYVEWGTKFPTNGNPNGMGGTGVSSVRYSGNDPDGPTLQINQANFPSCVQGTYAGMDGANGGNPCYVNSGNGGSGTPSSAWDGNWVGNIVEGAVGSAEAVLSEGGVAFVSRNGGSWQVLHNQNRPENSTLNMLWVQSGDEWAGTSGSWDTGYQMQRDARYNTNDYNPMLNVNAINLGSSRIEGLQINHLKIETLGGAAQ